MVGYSYSIILSELIYEKLTIVIIKRREEKRGREQEREVKGRERKEKEINYNP